MTKIIDDIEGHDRNTTVLHVQQSNNRIAVMGSRGGLGATTVAANLAALVTGINHRSVCLLDLDPYFGNQSLIHQLTPNQGLATCLSSLSSNTEINSEKIKESVQSLGGQLDLLASDIDLAQELNGNRSENIKNLMQHLDLAYDTLIFDCGRAPLHTHYFSKSTDCIILATMTMAGLRDTKRLLEYCEKFTSGRHLIVMSQTVDSASHELSEREFEEGLGRPIDLFLPKASKTLKFAALAAKPIVQYAPTHKLSRQLEKMKAMLSPTYVKNVKARRTWQKLWRIS